MKLTQNDGLHCHWFTYRRAMGKHKLHMWLSLRKRGILTKRWCLSYFACRFTIKGHFWLQFSSGSRKMFGLQLCLSKKMLVLDQTPHTERSVRSKTTFFRCQDTPFFSETNIIIMIIRLYLSWSECLTLI